MNEFDYRTKCRCIFILTMDLLEGIDTEIDMDFFNQLRYFFNEKFKEDFNTYYKYSKLLLYISINHGKVEAYENEKTINDLYRLMNIVNNQDNLLKLYNEIDQNDINIISELATEFIEFNDTMYDNYSRIIQ